MGPNPDIPTRNKHIKRPGDVIGSIICSGYCTFFVQKMCETHLNLWPVSRHAWAAVVLPPFEILLLIDGHQRLVELIVHSFHTDQIITAINNKALNTENEHLPNGGHLSLLVTSRCLWMERKACFTKLILFLSSSCDCSKMDSISSM